MDGAAAGTPGSPAAYCKLSVDRRMRVSERNEAGAAAARNVAGLPFQRVTGSLKRERALRTPGTPTKPSARPFRSAGHPSPQPVAFNGRDGVDWIRKEDRDAEIPAYGQRRPHGS
jgi:hypothetical protein